MRKLDTLSAYCGMRCVLYAKWKRRRRRGFLPPQDPADLLLCELRSLHRLVLLINWALVSIETKRGRSHQISKECMKLEPVELANKTA